MVKINNKIENKVKNTNTFGKRLCKSRKEKGLSQKKLADLLGYKQHVTISNLESDRATPDIESLQKIAGILEVDLHWLITGEIITPQNRIIAQFKEIYSSLLEECQEAQDAIQRLEAKKQGGQTLTAAEERELLTCRGIERTAIRQMENACRAAAEKLNTPGSVSNK